MSSDPADDALLAIALTIAERGEIQWGSVRRQFAPHDSALIDALQAVSELAAVRRAQEFEQPFVPARWCHLTVLGVSNQGGQGGHARFVARDDALGREVILTLIGPLEGNVALTERLLHRARQRAGVSHPNLAAVFGADYVHDRVGFWAEQVDGRSLAEIVASGGRFSVARVCEIVSVMCDALAAVHAAGLVNGGVSPDHIIESGDRFVLLASVCTELPQADGSCSPHADLAGLGRLLYFLLTGVQPAASNVSASLMSELRHARPDIGPPLMAVLTDLLSSDSPQRRYATALELGAAVRAAANDRLGAIEWAIGVALAALVTLVLLWYAFMTN